MTRRALAAALERAAATGQPIPAAVGRRLFAPRPLTETAEHVRLAQRLRDMLPVCPDLLNFFTVPNQEASKAAAKLQHAMGVSKGYPDCGLDVARGGYFGLRVELKRGAYWSERMGCPYVRGEPTPEQEAWHLRLSKEGYAMAVAWGTEPALAVFRWYLSLQPTTSPAKHWLPPALERVRWIV